MLCPGPLVEPRWHKITTTNLRRSSVASALEWRDDTERARDDTNARKVTEEMRGEVLRRTFERGPSPREVCSTSVTTNRTFRDNLVFAGRAAETIWRLERSWLFSQGSISARVAVFPRLPSV